MSHIFWIGVVIGLVAIGIGLAATLNAGGLGNIFQQSSSLIRKPSDSSDRYSPANVRIGGIAFAVLGVLIIVVSIAVPLSKA
jgi:hypothetical protein